MCSDEIKYALLVHSSQAEVLRFCESASGKVADSISRFILGRDLRDRRSLGHELWDLLMATQDRWSFGTSPESMETAFTLDPLLEVFDRGKFNRDLADLTSTATENQPLTLIMIDIDYFKPVNDTFGHPVGDAVLKKVAALIKAATDRKGHVYRYGGEEVAVLLPNFDVIEGLACGERVRQIIERTDFQLNGRQITISAGVSAVPVPTTAEKLVTDADSALYHAKHNGRNRVIRFGSF